MVVLVPPVGWIGDAEGGLICGDCAEPSEIAEWMAGQALVQQVMEGQRVSALVRCPPAATRSSCHFALPMRRDLSHRS